MAFFLNFVPNVGSIVAIFLPLPIILISPDLDMTILALAILLPGSVQMFIGNVIEPKMLGDSLDLHPITVLLSLIFWGMLWGIPGMLLAAPITAVLKILSENLEITAPVARLLSGKLGAKQKAADPSSDSSIEQAVPNNPNKRPRIPSLRTKYSGIIAKHHALRSSPAWAGLHPPPTHHRAKSSHPGGSLRFLCNVEYRRATALSDF